MCQDSFQEPLIHTSPIILTTAWPGRQYFHFTDNIPEPQTPLGISQDPQYNT